MTLLTLIWLVLPFCFGFLIYLAPKLNRLLALLTAIASGIFAIVLFFERSPISLQLLDSFGVTLFADQLSAYFILTNALVTAGVVLYCWPGEKTPFFFGQLAILHGSINAAFICADLVSLYVALEVSGIAAFLLIAYPRSDRSLWVALRYLFISNTAMLFYLVGAVLVYKASYTFSFEGLAKAPIEAFALIFLGFLVKAGVFVSGLWLPMTHSESETPVSAMMSGIVVKAGIYPIVRCALIIGEIDPIVRFFGVATALLGVTYAVFEKDTKRMLAFHTISQLGFILAAPEVGGFYALTHGLVKSALFLIAGALPSRNFKELQKTAIATPVWIVLVLASFSISGFPMLSGFGAKILTMKNLLDWQVIAMNVAAFGTAASFAKFIFLPRDNNGVASVKPGFWPAVVFLIVGLFIANIAYYDAYNVVNVVKPLVTIALGWLAYWFLFKKAVVKLPIAWERFEHLTGAMTLVLIALFWMAVSRSPYIFG
jgi:multicomponent Na+:H+ antiporter subunit D